MFFLLHYKGLLSLLTGRLYLQSCQSKIFKLQIDAQSVQFQCIDAQSVQFLC